MKEPELKFRRSKASSGGDYPSRKILNGVMEHCTTQNMRELNDEVYAWIYDKAGARDQFYNRHPEAYWMTQILVNAFRDNIPKEIDSTPSLKDAELIPWIQKVHEVFQKEILRQLASVLNSLDIDLIIAVSGEYYEKKKTDELTLAIVPAEECVPESMRFINKEKPKTRLDLTYRNVHAIRKQLNMSKNGALAICKNYKENVFCTVGLLAAGEAKKYLRFKFTSHMQWELCVPVADTEGTDEEETKNISPCRVRFQQGRFMLPKMQLHGEVRDWLSKESIGEEDTEKVSRIIQILDSENAGAVMIVLDNEVMDAERKRFVEKFNRGFIFEEPMDLLAEATENTSYIARLISIDGAILVDMSGRCHACGVILDGAANVEGDLGRGARFNSTKTYMNFLQSTYTDKFALGVVKSDDGMLDLIRGEQSEQTNEKIIKFSLTNKLLFDKI